jgi:hypothetical protein
MVNGKIINLMEKGFSNWRENLNMKDLWKMVNGMVLES